MNMTAAAERMWHVHVWRWLQIQTTLHSPAVHFKQHHHHATGDLHRLQPLVDLYFGHDNVPAIVAGLQAAHAALQGQESYEAAFVSDALALMQK
jgi:hypothetical protein